MMTRILLLTSLLICSIFGLSAQRTVKTVNEGGFHFKFPGDQWYLSNKTRINSRMNASFYKHVAIPDNRGVKVTPNVATIVEDIGVSGVEIVLYSRHHINTKRYKHIDLEEVKDIKTKLPESVVYRGTYTDPRNVQHTVYLVFAVHNNKALHFISDIRSDMLDEMNEEFVKIIESISLSRSSGS